MNARPVYSSRQREMAGRACSSEQSSSRTVCDFLLRGARSPSTFPFLDQSVLCKQLWRKKAIEHRWRSLTGDAKLPVSRERGVTCLGALASASSLERGSAGAGLALALITTTILFFLWNCSFRRAESIASGSPTPITSSFLVHFEPIIVTPNPAHSTFLLLLCLAAGAWLTLPFRAGVVFGVDHVRRFVCCSQLWDFVHRSYLRPDGCLTTLLPLTFVLTNIGRLTWEIRMLEVVDLACVRSTGELSACACSTERPDTGGIRYSSYGRSSMRHWWPVEEADLADGEAAAGSVRPDQRRGCRSERRRTSRGQLLRSAVARRHRHLRVPSRER